VRRCQPIDKNDPSTTRWSSSAKKVFKSGGGSSSAKKVDKSDCASWLESMVRDGNMSKSQAIAYEENRSVGMAMLGKSGGGSSSAKKVGKISSLAKTGK
jgi:hypothetical protein